MITVTKIGALTLAASLVFLGCESSPTDGDSTQNKAPVLPPTASMELPQFGNSNAAAKTAVNSAALNSNWNIATAAVGVWFWTSSVKAALWAPVALFKAVHALDSDPQQMADGSWKWSVQHGVHSADLIGKYTGAGVEWTMAVSNDKLQNFVWYRGVSSNLGKTGHWNFYPEAADPAEDMYQFAYDVSGNNVDVRAEVKGGSHAKFGNYLHWTEVGSIQSLTGYDAESGKLAKAQWNMITEAGFYEVDGNKACWDTKANAHKDIDC